MNKSLFLALALLLPGLSALGQTVTVTPSATTFTSAGSDITFTVTLSYTDPQSALGFNIDMVPAGWTYVSTGGTNVPQVAPSTGDTDNYGFAYFSIPTSPASFTFTVHCPSGLSADQVFSGMSGSFRPTGATTATIVPVSNITFKLAAAPAFTSANNATFVAGQSNTFTVTASGAPAATFSVAGTLPTGVTFNATTGVLSGTPTASTGSPFTLTFTATNSLGTVNQTFTLTVNQAPSFTTQPPTTRTVASGTATTLTVVATGNPTPTYKWQKMGGTDTAFVDITNDTTFSGATTASLTVNMSSAVDGWKVRAVATNTVGSTNSTECVIAIIKNPQTITFGALTAKTYGNAPFTLNATASSGLTVTYASSNTAVATVSGNTVTIVGAGTTNITASQAGNPDFNAATDVVQPLTVNKAAATITLGNLTATYDGTAKAATYTVTPSGLNVAVTYNGSATAPTNAGSYAVAATISGSNPPESNYTGSASGTLVIAQASQTITFGALPSKTYGDGTFTLSATGGASGLPVTFASSNTGVATISGNTVTIVGAGTTTITASQAGNTNYSAATNVPQTLTVSKAAATVALSNLSQVYNGSPRAPTATTTPAGLTVDFTYSPGSTATVTNAGTYGVTATINSPNYVGSATDVFVITKADQTINFAALPSKSVDAGAFTLGATATSGLTITYVLSNEVPADPAKTPVATLSGATVTPVNKGTVTITASQPGDNNYNPATSVAQVLTVLPQSQTITFAATQVPTKTFGDAAFNIVANSNRKLLVTFTSSNTAVATVATGTLNATTGDTTAQVTIVGAGAATITASQAGDSNTAAAPDVPQTLTVNKANQTITFAALANKTYLDAPFTVSATTTATGLSPVFSIVSGPATISGNTVTITGAGSVTVRAAQPGDSNYNAATNVDRTFTVAKANQTITGLANLTKLINAGPFTLGAAASSGLAVSYTSSNSAVATVTGNTVTIVGLGTTTLAAKQAGDANYNAATDLTATLTVNPVAPVIVSIPPLTATAVKGGSFTFGPITLNALSQPATFSATGLPAGLTISPASGNISGIPTAEGTFSVVITVTNATGTDSKTLALTVNPPAPIITSPAAASAVAGTAFTYTITATPSSGTGVPTFTAPTRPAWLSISGATLSGTPTEAGTFTVPITATNVTGAVTLPLVITVALPANAPIYSGTLNPSGTAGSAFSFTPNFGTAGTNATSYVLTGTLPTGVAQASDFATTGKLTGTPTQVGTFPVTLAATRVGLTASVTLNIMINPAATAPVVSFGTGGSVRTGVVGTAITAVTISGSGAPTSFTINTALLPPGLSVGGTATAPTISGTPTAFGTFNVPITATNTAGTGQAAILQFTIAPNPLAPVITSAPVVQGRVGVALTYTLAASPTGVATTYGMTGTQPPGLTFDGTAGTLSGTPTATGSYTVFFAGTNVNGGGEAADVTFSIAPALTVPVVNSNGTAAGQVGQPFSYIITATNSPTSFAATGLPAGLSAAGNAITGVPTTATATTPVSVTLTASNADGTSAPKTLLITIAPAPATPVITSGSSANGRVGTAFTYQITATETPTSYVATNLPPGLTVNPTTGAIGGTPTQSGPFTATIAAANAGGIGASATLAITIASAATAPAINSPATASGQVGTAFSYPITTTGGTATSYAVSGTLPDGLSLNTSTGVISGSPTTPGLTTVTLTATGDGGTSLPQSLVITIAPALGVPVVTSSNAASATAGASFSYTITATNMPSSTPFPPGTQLDAVNLPTGLAVNPATGVIQGVVSTVGSTTASLFGRNAAGTGPTRDLVINVQAPLTAPVVNSATTAAGQVGAAFSYAITATNTPTAFEVLGAPAWMTINSATGALAGTPVAPTTITVLLVASNSAGASNPVMLTINIAALAGTPAITSTRNAQGQVTTAFSYQVVSSPAADRYVAVGLPPGLAINATSGLISGIPTVSGAYQVYVSGSNSTGQGAPVRLTFTILPRATLNAPGN